MKTALSLILFFAVIVVTSLTASAQNYKIKQRMTMSGQTMESTVYVKGSRQRTESGGFMGMASDVATIQQCDLKRNVQVNDKKRLYFIDPFAAADDVDVAPARPVAGGKTVKGGTVTMTTSIVDTGERKQMFGLTARRIKTSMTMKSSPDACTKVDNAMETDGWYVDLPQFSCPVDFRNSQMAAMRDTNRGCEDRMIVKSTGTAKLGFPLELTQKMMSGGTQSFTQTIETLEFTKAALEDSLFNVPSEYSLASNSEDLYGTPDMSAILRDAQKDVSDPDRSEPKTARDPAPAAKRPGVKRIGVLMPSNQTGEAISTVELQSFLVRQMTAGNVEAVAINSQQEARSFDCDLLFSVDLSKLKQSAASKVGGLFGKVTGTDTSATQNYEAQVDYKMVSIADGRTVLQNKAAKKTSGDADAAVEAVLEMAAAAGLKAAK
jgi:hypothetical protein